MCYPLSCEEYYDKAIFQLRNNPSYGNDDSVFFIWFNYYKGITITDFISADGKTIWHKKDTPLIICKQKTRKNDGTFKYTYFFYFGKENNFRHSFTYENAIFEKYYKIIKG